MKCHDHKMQMLVSLYQLGILSPEHIILVEAHLMECDSCLNDAFRLSPVIELINDMPEIFLPSLQPRKTLLSQFINAPSNENNGAKTIHHSISLCCQRILKIPTKRILIPVAVFVSVLIILFMPRKIDVSDLAIIQKAPYFSFKLRAAGKPPAAEKLFEEAMAFYQSDQYLSAIERLSNYIKRKPDSIEGHFYLGISLLLVDHAESAIEQLTVAAKLAQFQDCDSLMEQCYWYLGNAYLMLNKNKAGIEQLTKVIDMQGEFENDAKILIAKIELRNFKN